MSFRIRRQEAREPGPPRFDSYRVSAAPNERILDCLNRIRWDQDPTLAYRMSCAHGVCGSDAMRINGVCALACQKLAKDYAGTEILLEPLPGFAVQKDLMVDLQPFFDKVSFIKPYLQAMTVPPSGRERTQSAEDQKVLDKALRCILCACCVASCPVYEEDHAFLGPASLVWAFRFLFDTRDEARMERLVQLNSPKAAWGCRNHFNCTRVCPKEIPVTRSINMIKREIQKYFEEGKGQELK